MIPLPEKAVRLDFDAQFSHEQFQRIREGFIGDHDNKWFFYFEEPWLYIFRADRHCGQCWWFLKFEPISDGYKVAEAWADSESLQWLNQDFSEFLYLLIDEYLPSSGEHRSLLNDISASYCVLRKGRVKLAIDATISVADMRRLGLKLIEQANQLDA